MQTRARTRSQTQAAETSSNGSNSPANPVNVQQDDELDIDSLLAAAKTNLASQSSTNEDSYSLEGIRDKWKQMPSLNDTLTLQSNKPSESGVVKLNTTTTASKTASTTSSSGIRKVVDPVKVKMEEKQKREATAGSKWFNMPKTEVTPDLKRDLQLLQMRSVLDPKRHYKKEKIGVPKYFQRGTIIEGNTEFYSARINKKDRRQTLAEEILADSTSREYFRRKYGEIQNSKMSGRKAFYKKLKEQRKKI